MFQASPRGLRTDFLGLSDMTVTRPLKSVWFTTEQVTTFCNTGETPRVGLTEKTSLSLQLTISLWRSGGYFWPRHCDGLVNLTGLTDTWEISKAHFWECPGQSWGHKLGSIVGPSYCLLHGCHQVSRFPVPHPSAMMLLTWIQPTMDWPPWSREPK